MDRQILRDWLTQAILWYIIASTIYVIYVTASIPETDAIFRTLFTAGWLAWLLALLRATRFRIEVDRDGLEIVNFFSTQRIAWSEILHASATFYGLRLSLTNGENVMARGITRPNVPWETKADWVADYINSEARSRRELDEDYEVRLPREWRAAAEK